jgi:hypothetical protein
LSGGGASGAVAVAVAVAEGLGNLTAPIRERERGGMADREGTDYIKYNLDSEIVSVLF